MNISKEILDFINSSDTQYKLSNEKKLIKVNMKDSNFINLYECDNIDPENTLGQTETRFSFIYDLKNKDVVYTNRALYNNNTWNCPKYFENVTKADEEKYAKLLDNIKSKMKECAYEKIKMLEPSIIDKIKPEDYIDEAKEIYKKKNKIKTPFERKYFTITPNIINCYYNNQDEFAEEAYKQLDSNDFKLYENFIGLQKAMELYKKQLEKDPTSERKMALCNLIDNDKYKTLTINYKHPNGIIMSEKINKTRSYNLNAKKNIMEDNNIQNIPIRSIQNITWSKKVLYDTNDFKDLNLTENDEWFDFAVNGNVNSLPEEKYEDKELMKMIIDFKAGYAVHLSDKLKRDKDFILELIKNKPNDDVYKIYLNIDDSLKKDKDFILKFLEIGFPTPYVQNKHYNYYSAKTNFLYDFEKNTLSCISDATVKIKSIEKIGINNSSFIKDIPMSVWNSKEMMESLQKIYISSNDASLIIGFYNSAKDIKQVLSRENIKENIDYINDILICDKNFMKDILNTKDKIRTSCLRQNDRIIKKYEDDDEICDLIAKNLTGIKQVATYVGIKDPTYDSLERFKLVNKNIAFLNTLKPTDMEMFFDGELFNVKDLNIYIKNDNIYIEAPNSNYEINLYGSISIHDKHGGPGIYKNLNYAQKDLFEVLNEKYPEIKSTNFRGKVKKVIAKEKEKTKEEIDR